LYAVGLLVLVIKLENKFCRKFGRDEVKSYERHKHLEEVTNVCWEIYWKTWLNEYHLQRTDHSQELANEASEHEVHHCLDNSDGGSGRRHLLCCIYKVLNVLLMWHLLDNPFVDLSFIRLQDHPRFCGSNSFWLQEINHNFVGVDIL
jgi:hypothetical protein